MATFERGTSPTLSMREKSLLKRRINKEHNSNFRAGYVNINEEQLHKTGIRGRKRYVIYIIIVLLALIVIANILMTATILAVLGIGRNGLSALEFTPGSLLLRFLQNSDMGDVYLTEERFGSLPNQPLEFTASHNGEVKFNVQQKLGSSVSVKGEKTVLQSSDVEILDPDSGDTVFSTSQDFFRFPEEARTIDTPQLITDRVTSDTTQRLKIEASKRATLAGYEGVSLGGRTISIKGKNLSFFTSANITLAGAKGTRFSFYRGLPVKQDSEPVRDNVLTYKLCVDSVSGEIFSTAWDASCQQNTP